MATILVVDDDPSTRVLLGSILGEELGHEVLFASDGEVGIATYERLWPDLVIADLVMPELHGVLMIEHLTEVHPDARIVAISGKAPEELGRAEAAGAKASLSKPIEREELVALVERLLADPGPWEGAR